MGMTTAARRAKKTSTTTQVVANDDGVTAKIEDRGIREIKDAIARSERLGEPVVIRTEISPRTATWLLSMNPENRRVSENTKIKYEDDLKNGRWQENGTGFAISQCLCLNDGQHRCEAIEKTEVTITTNVTVGLTRESRMTLDTGLKRSLSNQLDMEGYDNYALLGTMTKLIIGFENNKGATRRSIREISDSFLRKRIASDIKILDSAAFVRTLQIPKGFLSKTQIGFFHYLFKAIAPKDAEAFLCSLVMNKEPRPGNEVCEKTGELLYMGLMTDDPRYLAHARLAEAKKKRVNMTHAERVEIVFRAWNAWREGRSLSQLKIFGAIPELI